jgi:hypothetical protein
MWPRIYLQLLGELGRRIPNIDREMAQKSGLLNDDLAEDAAEGPRFRL